MLALFGIRRVDRNEPATVARMRQLARRAGVVAQGQLEEAVGYLLAEWLALNPGPLYHLLAQALEAHAIRTGEKREDVDQL